MIDISHSRKDLIDIIETYKLNDSKYLHGYNDMNKDILSQLLWKVVTDKRRKIDISNDTCFFFKDIDDLKKYISSKSPNVKLKNKDMIEIHTKIKNLNYYCKKCSYILEQSNYESMEDIIKDANIVRQYGNEPSVRRCIKLLNLDNKIKISFLCVMSNRTKRTLEMKDEIKKQTTPRLKIKKGNHIVSFE
tara:strand:+ start:42 stop:611 length:570 start_codon:yes stop_codon:yes gene_type:complete